MKHISRIKVTFKLQKCYTDTKTNNQSSKSFSGFKLSRKIASIRRCWHVLLQLSVLDPRDERDRLQSHLQQHRIPLLRQPLPVPHGLQGSIYLLNSLTYCEMFVCNSSLITRFQLKELKKTIKNCGHTWSHDLTIFNNTLWTVFSTKETIYKKFNLDR